MSSSDFNKTRYTHRDYASIKEDLISAIPSLTQEWTSVEESDPGIVLVKLMSMVGDTLNYNLDKTALELYLDSVTQRKNCAQILKLLGYKMHWYRTAQLSVTIENPEGSDAIAVITPKSTTLTLGSLVYTAVNPSAPGKKITINPGTTKSVEFIEGTYKEISVYTADINDSNKIYLPQSNIDETYLWLTSGDGRVGGQLVDNLYLVSDNTSLYFEFNVDEYDQPYIELTSNWRGIVRSGNTYFRIGYIVSSGAEGSVSQNTMITGSTIPVSYGLVFSHMGNTSDSDEYTFNRPGKDPESVDEARRSSSNYLFTIDTLVTSYDFERASRRYSGVENSKLVDKQVIINDGLDETEIIERDDFSSLEPYSAILYLIYNNFSQNAYSNEDFDPSDPLEKKEYYDYKPISYITTHVDVFLRSMKVINVELEYGTTKVYPFKVSGVLHFVSKLRPSEIVEIVSSVNINLEEYFDPEKRSYGQKPGFIEIVDVIQNTDTRIRYFDAEGSLINYTTIGGLTEGFDTTSFTKYQGLVDNSAEGVGFRIDPRFMTFTITNLTGEDITDLTKPDGEEYADYETITGVNIDNTETGDVVCETIPQLRTLVYYMDRENLVLTE